MPLKAFIYSFLGQVLRKHNIAFVAYNALAAGLLTGKHSREGTVSAGRCVPRPARITEVWFLILNTVILRGMLAERECRFKDNANYLPRFYTDANFQAVETIKAALPEGEYRCSSPH